MSPPLAGLPGHPPVLWRAGGPRSPAQEIWGADFELWGPDCPLAPGVWKDRIGGLEVECVGSGDWFRDANGYAGVTKADVCYGEASADVIPYLDPRDVTDIRTYACIFTDGSFDPIVGSLFCSRFLRELPYSYTLWVHVRPTGGTGLNRWNLRLLSYETSATGLATTTSSRPYPGIADAPAVFAWAIERTVSCQRLWRLAASSNELVWVDAGTACLTSPDISSVRDRSLRLFNRNGITSTGDTLALADSDTRDFRFLSLASAPGLQDPATIVAWASEYGLVMP